jgi:integrase
MVFETQYLQTGARRGELLGLQWADLDTKARTVTFTRTKNTLPRPIDAQAHVLPAWEPAALTVAFGRVVRALGIQNLTFHDLRHDAASALTMAGVPQRTVMAILGHRDPRMTLRYQHLSTGHLRDAARADWSISPLSPRTTRS